MSITAPFDYDLPYGSARMPVFGRQAVATSHPAAAGRPRLADGYCAGSDPRKDGQALAS